MRARVRKRSVLLIAAVVMATGVAIIGRLWMAGDESGSATRRATTVGTAETMTAAGATRIAKQVVESFTKQAATQGVRVLHCKLATPRQRYLCVSARPLTPAVVAAEIFAPPRTPERRARCLVQTEDGDLWTVEAGAASGCL
jgi:hypothetical protein